MNYYEILGIITALAGKKTDLNGVRTVTQLLGHPESKFSTIHVAGTNGKGSVCLKIAQALGNRTGLFTSPHLSCFRERIRIGGQKISEEAVTEIVPPILQIAKGAGIHLSFFEICTLLAYVYFAREKVDLAVIEVGLGGRLDATNIIHPLLSVITSIGLDHQEMLGATIEQIAREKGGIIKPKVPIIIGPTVPHAILTPLANSLAAPLTQVKGEYAHYGLENRAIAKAILEQLSIPYEESSLDIEPSCRFEIIYRQKRPIVFDVAHNPQGFEQLIKRLKHTFPNQPYHFLFSMSASKDIITCAKLLKEVAASVHIVEIDHPRLAPIQELKKHLPFSLPIEKCFCEENGVTVVCGSFFLMGPLTSFLARVAENQTFPIHRC